MKIILFLGVIFLFFAVLKQSYGPHEPAIEQTPEASAATKAEDAKVQRAVIGAISLKRGMRDPDSFNLESAYLIDVTGAVCYSYRANNGFGGVNQGQAVLPPNVDGLKTSEMKGFTKLWNKECANKAGTEVGAISRMKL